MKLFSSIAILLFFCLGASAQQKAPAQKTPAPAPAAKEEADTAKQKRPGYFPTGVRFGTDALALVLSHYDDSFDGWELNADADIGRYYVALDYGYWARDFQRPEEQYENHGTYYRFGVDVNFLTKDPDKNMFFIGGRYGHSRFSERLDVSKVDSLWGPLVKTSKNDHINGSWFELTTGIRVKIWKMIWMGYTARFKFGLNTNESGEMLPSDVPGFGRTDKEATWGFNYQIFVRVPVRKQK